jgi:uncharacterized paraquat-inducible protein A
MTPTKKEHPAQVIVKKAVECDDCGRVTDVPKTHPLRFCHCKECGSLKIRLYKPQLPLSCH